MKKAIVSVAIGERYVPLLERQARTLREVGERADHRTWSRELPRRAPTGLDTPWSAYCAKPFAMNAAWTSGADLLLWIDAACYLVKALEALWDHVAREGYYIQENGFTVGEWCSDAALCTLKITREESFGIPEISTMALALDMRRPECISFLRNWERLASDGVTFMGAHTNDIGPAKDKGLNYRGVAHVSDDPRVMGHRHDQTAASVIAHRLGWKRTPRPIFASYKDCIAPETLIVNHGGL